MRTLQGMLIASSLVLISGSACWSQTSSSGDVFAGQDPLEVMKVVMPQASNGQCIPPRNSNWRLLAQKNGECYFVSPFAKPLNGYVANMSDVGAVEKLGGRCGVDEFDPNKAVCFNPGDELPGALPTKGLPAGIGNSPPNNLGGGSGGGPGTNGGPNGGSPGGGPNGGPSLRSGLAVVDPCHPNYNMSNPAGRAAAVQNAPQDQQACNEERCKHNPQLPFCGGPPSAQPTQPSVTLHGGVQSDCVHLRAPYQGSYVLNNAQDLAQHLFDNYGTGKPIEITRISNRTNTYMVMLAGTEFGPGQANMVNVSNPFQPLTDMVQQAFRQGFNLKLQTFAQNLSDLLGQKALMSSVISLLRVEVASSQGRKTVYQQDVLNAVMQQVPRGATIIVVGHSLGGMDAENLLRNALFQKYYNPIELITFGSPITQAPLPGVRYVRYSSPTDIVRLAAIGSWLADPSQWIYVNNPGQNPPLAQYFQSTPSQQQQLQQAVVTGAMAAHLKYTISPDLVQYNVLNGTKNTATTLLLDAVDDHCFDAPNVLPSSPAPSLPANGGFGTRR
jgi:hypothetical protein